jgi:hypothetical protein
MPFVAGAFLQPLNDRNTLSACVVDADICLDANLPHVFRGAYEQACYLDMSTPHLQRFRFVRAAVGTANECDKLDCFLLQAIAGDVPKLLAVMLRNLKDRKKLVARSFVCQQCILLCHNRNRPRFARED